MSSSNIQVRDVQSLTQMRFNLAHHDALYRMLTSDNDKVALKTHINNMYSKIINYGYDKTLNEWYTADGMIVVKLICNSLIKPEGSRRGCSIYYSYTACIYNTKHYPLTNPYDPSMIVDAIYFNVPNCYSEDFLLISKTLKMFMDLFFQNIVISNSAMKLEYDHQMTRYIHLHDSDDDMSDEEANFLNDIIRHDKYGNFTDP